MKTISVWLKRNILFALAALGCITAPAQVQVSALGVQTATPALVESGPDYRVWQSLEPVRATTPGSGHVVELATGMNYWNGTSWRESVAQFQPSTQESAFVADYVQHRARINADINVQGAVTLNTPDGQLLYSTPVGIGLYDAASGQSLLLATITNTAGVLVGTNQVYFENAFRGGACASILYTIERNSFSQDVIFSGYLDPAAYGFPTNSTRVQIITELYQPPTPEILSQPMYVEQNPVLRQKMASPDLIDERLTFDRLVVEVGQAYTVPSLLVPDGSASLVAKQFVQTTDGRYFLIESVPYSALQTGFYTLPDCSPSGALQGAIRRDSLKSMLAALPAPPKEQKAKVAAHSLPGRLAQGSLPKRPSVVIDYRATLSSGATLIQGDTTYLVSGAVSCTTVTIEGGAVLKYKVGASLTVNSINARSSVLYRPTILTAVDDDTVGDSMNGYTNSGYTGTINSSGYANPALGMAQTTLTASGFIFRYAQKAIQYSTSSTSAATLTLNHAQLYKCIRGIDLTWSGCGSGCSPNPIALNLNNALMSAVQYPVYISNLSFPINPTLINCTVDQATSLVGGSGTPNFSSKNSVYGNITFSSAATFSGNNNGFYNYSQHFGTAQFVVSSSPFQSVGAANYYLTDASGFRNSGSSSGVSASLISDLGKRTTYSPLLTVQTTITNSQTLSPQAQRDTDALDLGYHYDPLDYEFGWVLVTNATLTVTNGTAIGCFGTNNGTYGLAIGQAAALQSQGQPNIPNWIVQFNTVQEQPYTNWFRTTNGLVSSEFQGLSPGSTINCRFTEWSMPAIDAPTFDAPTNSGPFNFKDCEFHGGSLLSARPTINLTNCLLERVYTDLEPKDGLTNYVRVGLVYKGSFTFAPSNSVVQDMLFDSTSITNWNGYSGGFNVYVTNFNRLQPTKSTDILLSTSPSYQVGPLGLYYELSTSSLINADTSTTADQVSLYHYTVMTNLVNSYEIKETNSLVDLSYHYVAGDTNGTPIDADGDGIADYLEDTNGDGVFDSGDLSNWQVYNSPNGLINGSGVVVFTPLK